MNDLEISAWDGAGYRPVVDYASWRVAFLNSDPAYLPENIDFAQCHRDTDEVFVLISGACTLILFGADEQALGEPRAVCLQHGRMYNVKKGVWHTHALAPDTKVLIVENRDTTNGNSPVLPLDAPMRRALVRACDQAGNV